jgi:hypothetical protein
VDVDAETISAETYPAVTFIAADVRAGELFPPAST